MSKKIMISSGSLIAIATPILAVVSCGDPTDPTSDFEKNFQTVDLTTREGKQFKDEIIYASTNSFFDIVEIEELKISFIKNSLDSFKFGYKIKGKDIDENVYNLEFINSMDAKNHELTQTIKNGDKTYSFSIDTNNPTTPVYSGTILNQEDKEKVLTWIENMNDFSLTLLIKEVFKNNSQKDDIKDFIDASDLSSSYNEDYANLHFDTLSVEPTVRAATDSKFKDVDLNLESIKAWKEQVSSDPWNNNFFNSITDLKMYFEEPKTNDFQFAYKIKGIHDTKEYDLKVLQEIDSETFDASIVVENGDKKYYFITTPQQDSDPIFSYYGPTLTSEKQIQMAIWLDDFWVKTLFEFDQEPFDSILNQTAVDNFYSWNDDTSSSQENTQ